MPVVADHRTAARRLPGREQSSKADRWRGPPRSRGGASSTMTIGL